MSKTLDKFRRSEIWKAKKAVCDDDNLPVISILTIVNGGYHVSNCN